MIVSRAAAIWLEYHRSHSRKNTLKSYQAALAIRLLIDAVEHFEKVQALGGPERAKDGPMYYTYVMESESKPDERYIGHSANLKQRLREHNAGKCLPTVKYKPWRLKLYVAFETERAQYFERYLKTGSGHAFANRHF